MPRYRTISCEHCGFMQLKRDQVCEQCGAMTARAKRSMKFDLLRFGLIALAMVGFYFYVQHVIHGMV